MLYVHMFVYVFKQKAAYKRAEGLVGAEGCIKDRHGTVLSHMSLCLAQNKDTLKPSPLPAPKRRSSAARQPKLGTVRSHMSLCWAQSKGTLKPLSYHVLKRRTFGDRQSTLGTVPSHISMFFDHGNSPLQSLSYIRLTLRTLTLV